MSTVNRRNKAISLGISIALLLALITLSYAYFTGSFKGSKAEIASSSGTPELTYTDCVDTEDCADISASLSPGDSVTKTFQIENTGTLATTYDLYFTTLQNSFWVKDLVYTLINNTTGTVIEDSLRITGAKYTYNYEIATDISIESNTTHEYTLIITFLNSDSDQSYTENSTFNLTLGIQKVTTLSSYILANVTVGDFPDESTTATTDEGVIELADDDGITYVFRGAVTNNYVYFAGYYWRIIRINGDGSIRMIYDGTTAHANGDASEDRHIGTSLYNSINTTYSSYGANAYVGYMYGIPRSSTSYDEEHANTNDSDIKKVLDTWYENNLLGTTYEKYISDEVFCNDRSIYSGTGYGTTATYYAGYQRIKNNTSTSVTDLECPQDNDKFTVSTSNGNGALTYPIGLITADETVIAGAVYGYTNTSYYLYTGSTYLTMTPRYWSSSAYLHLVSSDGYISSGAAPRTDYYVRPVINLSANVLYSSGNGTSSSPYTVG